MRVGVGRRISMPFSGDWTTGFREARSTTSRPVCPNRSATSGPTERHEAIDADSRSELTIEPGYLLSHPMAADDIASALEALGHSHLLQDGTD